MSDRSKQIPAAVELIHYLKFDPAREIEEEATLPVDDTARIMELLQWFHHGTPPMVP
jgi:hypothetical protein